MTRASLEFFWIFPLSLGSHSSSPKLKRKSPSQSVAIKVASCEISFLGFSSSDGGLLKSCRVFSDVLQQQLVKILRVLIGATNQADFHGRFGLSLFFLEVKSCVVSVLDFFFFFFTSSMGFNDAFGIRFLVV